MEKSSQSLPHELPLLNNLSHLLNYELSHTKEIIVHYYFIKLLSIWIKEQYKIDTS